MCNCINTTNALLKEHNGQLVCTLFGEPSRVVIETIKLDPKKRGKSPAMLASYCPFCGEEYSTQQVQP